MLAITSEPPADATAMSELDRIADEIQALPEGVTGMYAPALLHDADDTVATQGATALLIEMEPIDETLDATLVALGFDCTRELLQLRRDLPLDPPTMTATIETRPFVVGQDEQAWLELNNRAFDWHPEQGGWTLADVVVRLGEPWFDPAGFLLLEQHDELVGFCWTKIHPATDHDPTLGEIYVIASAPELHGQGLGRQLTLAGLEWLAGQGIATAMLYVESDNYPARHLYEDVLGFHTHLSHRWYRRPLP